MKIEKLRLLAYGPFTGRELDLGAASSGLHLIFGPNEAGKSSCLRALHALLYGIPERTDDTFIHKPASLRLGGRLRHSSGLMIDFVRRKARKNALRDAADEAVLPDEALAPFLDGVDEPTFKSRFALDHAQLVAGGLEIASAGGRLGELLFAAGTGAAALRQLQDALRDEADSLYKVGGRLPSINRTRSELQAARKALQDAQLSVDQWQSLERRLADALNRRTELDIELTSTQAELNRLQRMEQALPVAGRWRQTRDELQAEPDAPELAADFPRRREQVQARLHAERKRVQDLTESLAKLDAELAGEQPSQALLAEGQALEDLKLRLGSHRKAMSDRPQLVAQSARARADEAELLSHLGRAAEEQGVPTGDRARPPLADHVRIAVNELARQQAGLVAELDLARRECRQLQRDVNKAEFELARDATGKSTPQATHAELTAWQARLRRLQTQSGLTAQKIEMCAGAARLDREIQRAASQLPLWQGAPEELAALVVPSEETIDRYEEERARLEVRCAELRDDERTLRASLEGSEARLAELEATQQVPTEAELWAARERRERGWSLVVQAWQSPPADAGEIAEFVAVPAGNLAEAYAMAVAAADELADRLRREADRVAEKATLLVRLDQARAQNGRLQESLAAASQACAAWQTDWRALWANCGLEPASPREMRAWRRRQQEIAAQVVELATRRAAVDALDLQATQARIEIGQFHAELGLSLPAPDASFDELLEQAAAQLDFWRDAAARSAELRERLPGLREDLLAAREREQECAATLDRWQTAWAERMQALDLSSTASTAEAGDILDKLAKLDQGRHELARLDERIAGIDADAQAFAADVRSLAERAAPELASRSLEEAIAELNRRLDVTRQAATRRQACEDQARTARQHLELARETIEQLEGQLAQLCREAHCDAPDELHAAERRSLRRQQQREQLTACEEQLLALAGGQTSAALLAEIQQESADSLAPRIENLARRLKELRERRDAVLHEVATVAAEQRQLVGQDGAIVQAEEYQALLARLENDVQRLAVLRLASGVLRETIERYRQKNQGAVLQFASETFALLTCGSFTALRPEIDEDQHLLVGVRGDGNLVRVDQMSEGTRDQLFLALRLASVRARLADGEPLPLVVDDVLVNFDDERAVAALVTLAHLAEHVQVILLTHHQHIVELARKYVPQQQLTISELG